MEDPIKNGIVSSGCKCKCGNGEIRIHTYNFIGLDDEESNFRKHYADCPACGKSTDWCNSADDALKAFDQLDADNSEDSAEDENDSVNI